MSVLVKLVFKTELYIYIFILQTLYAFSDQVNINFLNFLVKHFNRKNLTWLSGLYPQREMLQVPQCLPNGVLNDHWQ